MLILRSYFEPFSLLPFPCSMERNLPSRTVVMTVLLFLFANSRKRIIPIESDNVQRDRFRLRGHVIEFPPRKSMTCKIKIAL